MNVSYERGRNDRRDGKTIKDAPKYRDAPWCNSLKWEKGWRAQDEKMKGN